jgi:hypothetical protein
MEAEMIRFKKRSWRRGRPRPCSVFYPTRLWKTLVKPPKRVIIP